MGTTTKAKVTNVKADKRDCIVSLHMAEEERERKFKLQSGKKKIGVGHMPQKLLISKIYKESKQVNTRKPNNLTRSELEISHS